MCSGRAASRPAACGSGFAEAFSVCSSSRPAAVLQKVFFCARRGWLSSFAALRDKSFAGPGDNPCRTSRTLRRSLASL